ncbi:MAG: diacylglycerol kinase [Deltaproteobacteria bacterium]|nr:diacylglycerol kinase [Deltaproteobacteria bacterium]MBW1914191.1 diacylglycerol kinase [Deltaproteobacteria bacterium]
MANIQNTGIRRLLNAVIFSKKGFQAAWKKEEAFRQEIICCIFVIPLGFWLGTTYTQRAILIGFFMIIPITELLNAGIETVVDRISKEHHVLSGQAKDIGSAAVFLSICTNLIVWGLIAYERFFRSM